MTSDILRCPFCDKDPILEIDQAEDDAWISCATEGCALKNLSFRLGSWNRRPATPDDGKGQPVAWIREAAKEICGELSLDETHCIGQIAAILTRYEFISKVNHESE